MKDSNPIIWPAEETRAVYSVKDKPWERRLAEMVWEGIWGGTARCMGDGEIPWEEWTRARDGDVELLICGCTL